MPNNDRYRQHVRHSDGRYKTMETCVRCRKRAGQWPGTDPSRPISLLYGMMGNVCSPCGEELANLDNALAKLPEKIEIAQQLVEHAWAMFHDDPESLREVARVIEKSSWATVKYAADSTPEPESP